jgi:ferrochelatase
MIALLMMAHGTPERTDQMEAYLTRVRGGRRPSPELIEEMSHNYAAIGGRSPLTELTLAQGRALEEMLGSLYRVFVGMRNWRPFIEDAVADALEAGADRIIGLPMAPQYSELSVGKYLDAVAKAVPQGFPLTMVHSWYDHPGFLDALAEKVCKAERGEGSFDRVVFTAHSLPERVKDVGEMPYPAQVRETAAGVAERVGLKDWSVAYQSAGRTPEPWLGPDLKDVLDDCAQAGLRRVLVVPVGFVCDHTEILYDIDIEARAFAEDRGVELARSESLNCSPTFIRALADIAASHVES